ncbi:SMI1/KNR4 family protein [Streptomyces sp. NPDC007076]|uniref:SMI1/KNR4 family protein n=1 Tax=unclassified Streptomyces TaxID=2593676 RepID=UPI00339464D0
MLWIERIEEAVVWRPINLQINWGEFEDRIGSPLPSDFKRMCESFGSGQFSGYLDIYSIETKGTLRLLERLSGIQRTVRKNKLSARVYDPYGIFSVGDGKLIPWAESVTGAEFFWLANSPNPDRWPVIARPEDGEWSHFPFTASEFTYRLLADPEFDNFGISHLVSPPFYDLY